MSAIAAAPRRPRRPAPPWGWPACPARRVCGLGWAIPSIRRRDRRCRWTWMPSRWTGRWGWRSAVTTTRRWPLWMVRWGVRGIFPMTRGCLQPARPSRSSRPTACGASSGGRMCRMGVVQPGTWGLPSPGRAMPSSRPCSVWVRSPRTVRSRRCPRAGIGGAGRTDGNWTSMRKAGCWPSGWRRMCCASSVRRVGGSCRWWIRMVAPCASATIVRIT